MQEKDLNIGVSFIVRQTEFITEYEWSRRWIPTLCRLIGPHILREATLAEDQRESTDLTILKANGLRIACRVRRPGYAAKWPHDFTITSRRESGAPCEWVKMIEQNWGDWFFYGHARGNEAESGIQPWYLINLDRVRPWIRMNLGKEQRNLDAPGRGCWFRSFDVRLMARDIPYVLIDSRLPESDSGAWLFPRPLRTLQW